MSRKRKAPNAEMKISISKAEENVDGDNLSAYEQLRIENIKRNEEELRRLGLHLSVLTTLATGKQAPTEETIRRRAVPPRTRWSSRLQGQISPNYRETSSPHSEPVQELKTRKRKEGSTKATVSANPKSCKNLNVAVQHLYDTWLGKIIPPQGGQVKKAAMDEATANGTPTFSRMSGIQEFKDGVCLFINVFGEGYKNVFLDSGCRVTWFAQSQQWEGSPVIQRMINSSGGVNADGTEVSATPVLLFARSEGQGYVYCGQLAYEGHDPERVPIRFVWTLSDFQSLRGQPAFRELVENCNRQFLQTDSS